MIDIEQIQKAALCLVFKDLRDLSKEHKISIGRSAKFAILGKRAGTFPGAIFDSHNWFQVTCYPDGCSVVTDVRSFQNDRVRYYQYNDPHFVEHVRKRVLEIVSCGGFK